MSCITKARVFLTFFFFQAEDGIRDLYVTGVQTCALPIFSQPTCFASALPIASLSRWTIFELPVEGSPGHAERSAKPAQDQRERARSASAHCGPGHHRRRRLGRTMDLSGHRRRATDV